MVKILHSVHGRARFKVKGLYRAEALKKQIESKLQAEDGICSFKASVLTGNIVVFFNSNKTPHIIASFISNVTTAWHKDTASYSHTGEEQSTAVNRQVKSRRKLRRLLIHAEEQRAEPWHLLDAVDVLRMLGVKSNVGLTEESAQELLKKYGPNVLPESVPRSGFSIFISQFKSLPVILLGIAAGISVLTGGIADAIIIAGVVTINAFIGYTTESHAEKIIYSLKSLVRPSALVIRDCNLKAIGAEDITRGDIIVLRPGSYVAADARLIETNYLSVDESMLTGESMPVLKSAKSLAPVPTTSDIPLADRINMVYMGTLVTGGQGIAVVVATGRFTEIGKIQTLVGEAKAPETPMERQLNRLGTQLVLISGVVCGIVFIIGLIRGYGILQMLKISISLAVAAVPEGLPTVATTTLALGIRNMKRHNVLIRHLDAVETLGSVQTICLDKTGTITLNRMTVISLHTGMRRLTLHDGKFFVSEIDDQTMQNKHHRYIRNYVSPYHSDELLRLVHICVLCNESEIIRQNDKYTLHGSPTENALIHMALSTGVNIEMIRKRFPVFKITHRSENRNFMVTIHDIKIQGSENHHGKLIAVKGSPNEVLSLCNFHMKDSKKIPLTEDDRFAIETENERMAGDALRVLGVAYAFIDEGTTYYEFSTLNSELIWLGLVGMADPIRSGVKELISSFHSAGIDTIMITGDQSPTAYAIAKELNLSKGEEIQVLDSTHLTNIEPDAMMAMCERVHVFSRVSPAHKLHIVQALQRAGKIVAMTGDGINDGPALKAANIGIALGHTGTDVAREVADIVLEDDNLETMIIAISHGRTIYNNIRKSVHFLLSTNMSEIMLMFAGIAGGLGQPLSAMQLLWINLISDIAPGIALALEPPEPDVLSRPPRDPNEQIIKSSDFKRITFESSVLSAGALGAYGYGISRYGMGQQAGTMAFASLTLGQIFHAISCRSEQHSIFDKERLPPNRYINTAIAGSLLLQLIAMTLPGLRNLLGITPLSIIDYAVIGSSAVIPLLVNEGTKKAMK